MAGAAEYQVVASTTGSVMKYVMLSVIIYVAYRAGIGGALGTVVQDSLIGFQNAVTGNTSVPVAKGTLPVSPGGGTLQYPFTLAKDEDWWNPSDWGSGVA